MIDWLRNATAPIPVHDPPDEDVRPDWEFDPAQPATHTPQSLESQLADLLESLSRLVAILTPGIPGVEGAEQWPVLAHDAFTVRDSVTYTIPGNRNRTSALIHNLGDGVVYVVADGSRDAARGMPIPVNAEREIRTPNPIRLIAATGTTASVRILEESS